MVFVRLILNTCMSEIIFLSLLHSNDSIAGYKIVILFFLNILKLSLHYLAYSVAAESLTVGLFVFLCRWSLSSSCTLEAFRIVSSFPFFNSICAFKKCFLISFILLEHLLQSQASYMLICCQKPLTSVLQSQVPHKEFGLQRNNSLMTLPSSGGCSRLRKGLGDFIGKHRI